MKKSKSTQAHFHQTAQVAEYLGGLAAQTQPQDDFAQQLEADVVMRWAGMCEEDMLTQRRKGAKFFFHLPFAMGNYFQGRETMLKRSALVMLAVLLVVLVVPLWRRTSPDGGALLPRLASAQGGGATVAEGLLSGAELVLEATLPTATAAVSVYQATLDWPTTAGSALEWARDFGLINPHIYHNPHDAEAIYVKGEAGRTLNFRMGGPAGGLYYTNDAVYATPGAVPTFVQASEVAVAFLRKHDLLPDAYHVENPVRFSLSPDERGRTVLIQTELDGRAVVGSDAAIYVYVNGAGEVLHASVTAPTFTRLNNYPIKSAEQAWQELLVGDAFRLDMDQRASVTHAAYRTFRRAPRPRAVGDVVTVTQGVQLLAPAEDGQPVWAQMFGHDGVRYDLSDIPDVKAFVKQVGFLSVRVRGTLVENLGPNAWRLAVEDWEVMTSDPLLTWVGTFIKEDGGAYLVDDVGDRYRLPDVPLELENGTRIQVVAPPEALQNAVLEWNFISTPPAGEQERVSMGVSTVTVAVQVDTEAPGVPMPEAPFAPGEHVVVTGTLDIVSIIDGEKQKWGGKIRVADENGYALLADDVQLEALSFYHRLHVQISGTAVTTTIADGYPPMLAIQVDAFAKLWADEQRYRWMGQVAVENIAGQDVAVLTDCDSQDRYVLGPQVQIFGADFARRMGSSDMRQTVKGSIHAGQTHAGLPVIYMEGMQGGSATSSEPCQPPRLLEPGPRIEHVSPHSAPLAMVSAFTVDRVELAYYYAQQFSSVSPYAAAASPSVEPVLVQPVWIFSGHSGDGAATFTAYVQAVRERYVADVER